MLSYVVRSIFIIFSCSVASASQGLLFSTGIISQTSIFESSFPGVADNGHFGLGIVGEASSEDYGSLESSIYFYQKHFYRETSTSYRIDELDVVEFALGYRYWPFSRFSLGFSFATTYPIGSAVNKKIQGTEALGLETSAQDITEYYLVTNMQFVTWREPEGEFVLEIRHSNSFTSRAGENANQIGVALLFKQNVSRGK